MAKKSTLEGGTAPARAKKNDKQKAELIVKSILKQLGKLAGLRDLTTVQVEVAIATIQERTHAASESLLAPISDGNDFVMPD